MKLYTYYRSSCTWRVRIALNFKGVSYEPVHVHLMRGEGEQHAAGFVLKNPMAQIPVLEVEAPDGTKHFLSQSLAILEYLEETHPEPALLPQAPLSRAAARRFAEIVNSGVQPFQNITLQKILRGVGVDPIPVVRGYIERGLGSLEELAQGTSGSFLVGDAPSFADVCMVPQLFWARRLELDVGKYPVLQRVEQRCKEIPAFQAAAPEAQADYEA